MKYTWPEANIFWIYTRYGINNSDSDANSNKNNNSNSDNNNGSNSDSYSNSNSDGNSDVDSNIDNHGNSNSDNNNDNIGNSAKITYILDEQGMLVDLDYIVVIGLKPSTVFLCRG